MNDVKVLLLNSTYEALALISERKALRLFVKGKVEIISTWADVFVQFVSGNKINFPAIIKLKYYIKKSLSQLAFSRRAVLKRDKLQCAYCGRCLNARIATIDHIVPKSSGGASSFLNCVTSCGPCNRHKGNKTLGETGMKLLFKPYIPAGYLHFFSDDDRWHDDWDLFLPECQK